MNREDRFASIAKLPFDTVGRDSQRGTVRNFARTTQEVWAQKEMLWLLVRRDLKSKYKDSALGLVWTLVRPITQLIIYYVVLGHFLGAERGIPLFAIYIFTGLTAYGLFQDLVSGGTNSIIVNSGLVKKVYVPRELFPLASAGTAIFNFLIQSAILLAACLLLGNLNLSWDLWYLVPSTLTILSFGVAAALLFSAWNVYLRDVGYLVEVLLMVLLWASPILYSWQMVRDAMTNAGLPWLLDIYTGNPITLAILGFQKAIWGTEMHGLAVPENLPVLLCSAMVIGFLCVYLSQRVFARMQGNFAQEL